MTTKNIEEKPDWHSQESWTIECLDWENNPADFNRLYSYVFNRIDAELQERGRRLQDILSETELRNQLFIGAKEYGERHRIIGLATHVSLWIRAVVAEQIKVNK